MRVAVPVIKSFVHDGAEVRPGAVVRLEPIQAAALAHQGYVSLLHGQCEIKAQSEPVLAPAPVVVSAPVVAPAKPKRQRNTPARTYRRKDMRATA